MRRQRLDQQPFGRRYVGKGDLVPGYLFGLGNRVETDSLYVKTAFVDGGPSMKRMLPAPMGRAFRIMKRSNHLTIIIAQRELKAKKLPQPKVKEAQPKVKEPQKKQA